MQPLRCINYFQITRGNPHPFEHRHEEDYGKCRRMHFSLLLLFKYTKTSDCFYRIYLYFSTLVWYTLNHLAVRRTLLLMMFAHFMSSICGSWLVDVWILDSDWFRYYVNWSYLKSNRLFIFSPFLFHFLKCFFSLCLLSWNIEKAVVLKRNPLWNSSHVTM